MRDEVAVLDAGTADEFAASLAPLFEGAPAFLARLAAARPFRTWDALFRQARATAHAMPESDQVELVDAHPQLGAPPGSVSALAFREQGYDRERSTTFALAALAGDAREGSANRASRDMKDLADDGLASPFDDDPPLSPGGDAILTPETALERERLRIQAKLDYLNAMYEARFGFRYCVFVAGRPRSELIPEMAAALARERDSELHRALDAVVDIAADRHRART